MATLILGIDPGRVKTGIAIVANDGAIAHRAIVPTAELRAHLETLLEERNLARIVLGNSTGSAQTATLLEAILGARNLDLQVEIIDERDSTLQARALYFETHVPRGWRRVVPLSLQNPPEAIDDFAAVVLARRALET
ncbi:RNase H-fold protein, predicted Holliday junction resolvase [Abditibacterium utsteinense]|uniref:RNase H-fold protein, predicted Holliday junction resolvase n=1 Tax=Abditibacterium utsteinense TaxID=1960156 RepID=A0A2S8SUW3_9BACT|nr:Holliday junction resolvase RuvX [Abditibacterium utsteinense]PQV64582.1 RNase H-fold protein, predicted Holliday junction resolvase [Abditibacterium utsteinense]